jgi:predicted nucleotidyltransferase component of viral defense system
VELLTNPHWEALTSATQAAFHLTSHLSFISNYYLAGGTGLALHLGHRFSIDLDYFSPEKDSVGPSERAEILQTLNDPSLSITFDKDTTFVGNWRGVGLSFFRLDMYPLVQPPFLLEGVPVATIEEIGAMKLAAIIDRGSRKDMIDLYYLLQKTTLEELFQVAATKYAPIHSFAVTAIRGMAYFADAERQPMPQMIDKTPWSKMHKFLDQKAMQAGRLHFEDLWI